jgi:tRNA (guanine26-N2/guanine27-N2)-dimethyltransferase
MLRATLADAAPEAPGRVFTPGAPGRRPRFAGAQRVAPAQHDAPATLRERGVAFTAGSAFFRPQAVHARDLAVLAALLSRRSSAGGGGGAFRVLDLLTGSGIRALRYLRHAGATFVHANDIDGSSPAAANLAALGAEDAAEDAATPAAASWRVTREESCRLLMRLALEGETFDVVDVDGFGSKGVPAGLALGCVKFGGLLIANSTDWSLGSQNAQASASSVVSAYGALLHPCPSMPEQGLRVLLGAVAREAAQRGLRVAPVLSYYAPGPAWRCTVRVFRGGSAAMTALLGFNAHCATCGAAWTVPWSGLGGGARCACGAEAKLSGPLWQGPLHDAAELRGIAALADELGWSDTPPFEADTAAAAAVPRRSLRRLLEALVEEAEATLPPFCVRMEELSRAGRAPHTPRRDELIAALRERGHAATRTHCDERALKTDAPWETLLQTARDVCHDNS